MGGGGLLERELLRRPHPDREADGGAFEDAVRALVLDPAGLDWHADAEPEPRTLGYSRWNPGGPGRRSPDSFRGHAGPAGWHSSACGLAQGAWSLFHGGLLPVRLRDAMRTEELGIFARDEGGLPIWLHSGVWTPGGGQGFELGLADLPGGVTGGFATNTWGNFRGAEVVRTLWRSHTPRVEVRPREGRDGPDGRVDREGTGSRAVTVALHYDAVPGAVLRWTTDPALPLSSGSTYRGPFVLPSVGTVRVAAFLDGRLASLPVTVPLGGVAQAPVPERPPARPTSSPRSDGSR